MHGMAQAALPVYVAAPPNPKASLHEALLKPRTLAIAGLAILLGLQWWSSNQELRALREEMAKRLQSADMVVAEARVMSKDAQGVVQDLRGKYSVLENRQQEAQNQQLALEQLYQELSRNRDDWALAEVEQVLSTADQQLQLAGNVQGALIALQNADRSLSRSDNPPCTGQRHRPSESVAQPRFAGVGTASRQCHQPDRQSAAAVG